MEDGVEKKREQQNGFILSEFVNEKASDWRSQESCERQREINDCDFLYCDANALHVNREVREK